MNESREASVHALVGAYAIDALDDDERYDFEQHLAECADCQAEVASMREAAAVLGGSESMAPPASVRRNVLAGIAGTRAPQSVPSTEPDRTVDVPAQSRAPHDDSRQDSAHRADVVTLSRRRFRAVAAGAAAAVIAAVGVGAVVLEQSDSDESSIQARPSLAEQVQGAADAEDVAVTLDGGARATVYRSSSMGRAVIVTEDMPPPPEGKAYELWFDDKENGFTPAGLMSTTSDQTLLLKGDAARATRVGITVEPAQGSRVPTTDPIAVFTFDPEPA